MYTLPRTYAGVAAPVQTSGEACRVIQPALIHPTVAAVQNLTAAEAASLGGMMASGNDKNEHEKRKLHLRKAAGDIWNDPSLDEWPEDDYRVFCGDLGNEVTDDVLGNAFKKYPSFLKAKVVRDRKSGKSKGFGFISFHNPEDMLLALKEMNKKYVGNRPIRVMKSKWKEREINSERNKELADVLRTVQDDSKKLKKFKKIGVPVTGGKRGQYTGECAIYRPRGYYGPGGTARLAHYPYLGTVGSNANAAAANPHMLANI